MKPTTLHRQQSVPVLRNIAGNDDSRKENQRSDSNNVQTGNGGSFNVKSLGTTEQGSWTKKGQNSFTNSSVLARTASVQDKSFRKMPSMRNIDIDMSKTEVKVNQTAAMEKEPVETILGRERYKNRRKDAARLLQKFGMPTTKSSIDMLTISKMLKDSHPEKREALPRDVKWAFDAADVWKDGTMGDKEIAIVLADYEKYLKTQPTLRELIQKCDANHDGVLDHPEFVKLLKLATADNEITLQDGQHVLAMVRRLGDERFLGGYISTMSSDPDILGIVISKWYAQTHWGANTDSPIPSDTSKPAEEIMQRSPSSNSRAGPTRVPEWPSFRQFVPPQSSPSSGSPKIARSPANKKSQKPRGNVFLCFSDSIWDMCRERSRSETNGNVYKF